LERRFRLHRRFDQVLDGFKDHVDFLSLRFAALPPVASSSWVASNWRKRTKVRKMAMFTAIARLLFKTPESIAMPCSVNAYGGCRRPPQLDPAI
jgi:hypothetical protein